jgi:predicted nucleic acid-binding OB-fold protein
MADKAVNKIDINSAGAGILTQLPGIAKNTAYKIINHRQRHGLFTAWEELAEVKDFPIEKLEAIKERAELICKDEGCRAPRHLKAHVGKARKKPRAKQRP